MKMDTTTRSAGFLPAAVRRAGAGVAAAIRAAGHSETAPETRPQQAVSNRRAAIRNVSISLKTGGETFSNRAVTRGIEQHFSPPHESQVTHHESQVTLHESRRTHLTNHYSPLTGFRYSCWPMHDLG